MSVGGVLIGGNSNNGCSGRPVTTGPAGKSLELSRRQLHCAFKGILYRKMNRNSIKGPLKAGGRGSKGVEARIEDTAARSSGSLLELPIIAGSASGTTPLRMMRNCRTTFPRSPRRADSGITAYQLRLTLARTRAM